MSQITTGHSIFKELQETGYSIVESKELQISKELFHSKIQFVKGWDNLEIDDYMKDGGKYRLRRYGQYMFNSLTKNLEYISDVTYFQSEDLNPVNGGLERKFSPLRDQDIDNEFLLELIRFDFDQIPFKHPKCTNKWKVGIHQIRILAEPNEQGLPAPEGIHKDGEMVTVQHLIKRENIVGGMNSVYDNNKVLIHSWTQQSHFDSYYFIDEKIYHSVTEIRSKDNVSQGYRDVLLIDFDPVN